MDCKICELKQRQFICGNCLRSHLRDNRLKTQRFATERDEQIAKASGALKDGVNDARIRRAGFAKWESRVRELDAGLKELRTVNECKRDRIRALRQSLSTRRQTLTSAKSSFARSTHPHKQDIDATQQKLEELSGALARARSGLVQELVEVFHVVEVGGRPPLGGRTGTKGEWSIGNLLLPVPGDIRRYPPTHINAVITHTIHFIGLLTFYLGVRLPFEVEWSGKKLGVGQPWIGAGRGSDSGTWVRWSTKHPLHLSPSPIPIPSTATPQHLSASQILSESYAPTHTATHISQPNSFTTAFAMLLFNVCYLAHTQSIDIPLSQAGDVLSNLWAICCSPELGRRSHANHPLLAPPTPPSFPLDFAQLLQATTATPASRKFSMLFTNTKLGRHEGGEKEKITEEEEGWDLVEDL